jgi:hypothetical protein
MFTAELLSYRGPDATLMGAHRMMVVAAKLLGGKLPVRLVVAGRASGREGDDQITLFKSRRYGGPGRHCRVCRLSGGTPSGHRFRSPRLPGTENFLGARVKSICAHRVLRGLAAVEKHFCAAFECSLRNFELAGHPNSARRLSE